MESGAANPQPIKVLIGPTEIAGFATSLAQCLRAQGMRADLLELAANPFGYAGQRLQWLSIRIARWLRGYRIQSGSRLIRALIIILELPFRLWCLIRVAVNYDAYIWLTGGSVLPASIDMPLLRLLRKRQVCVFLGSESRPPYLSGLHVQREPTTTLLAAVDRLSHRVSRHVAWCERWCDHVVNHPPAAQFHQRDFIDFASLGYPPPPHLPRIPLPARDVQGSVRVVHAPSRPRQKGTAVIRAAMEQLVAAGMSIDYREYTGVDNALLLQEIANADLVIDELYSDTPIGGVGREAAVLGVPCLVCGYAGQVLAEVPGFSVLPPGCLVPPEKFLDAARELVSDSEARARLAAMQHSFVSAAWAATAVGERYRKLLRGNPDPRWIVRANHAAYFLGWGTDRDSLQAFLARYVEARGPGALYLGHAPLLREEILRMIRG